MDLSKVEQEFLLAAHLRIWKFVERFEYYIENMVKDDGQRLLYLLHSLRGQARVPIEQCILLPSEVAYKKAGDVLRDLLSSALLKGLKSIPEASAALTKLSLEMLNYEFALTQINFLDDLNALQTSEQVVLTLPTRTQ